MSNETTTFPAHFSASMGAFWVALTNDYDFEPAQLHTLRLACEAYDRSQSARESLEANGLVFVDRFDQPKPRPECAIARDNSALFARLIRELNVDVEAPESPRLPRPGGRYR